MPANTIKLDSDLVRKVSALKHRDESITAFVRELIEREHAARRYRLAATTYLPALLAGGVVITSGATVTGGTIVVIK
jgi:predicted transcriptional regulator